MMKTVGMMQSRKRDSESVVSFQKCLIGVQCQVAWRLLPEVFCVQCEPMSDCTNPILNYFCPVK